MTNEFDFFFQHFTKYYFQEDTIDWKWFKAQGMAESNLTPDAESPVGAMGIMQVMPATFAEIQEANLWMPFAPTDPLVNIAAGIYYMKKMYDMWTSPRPFEDRMKFAFASYNAGAGHILNAQKACQAKGNTDHLCNLWKGIVASRADTVGWKYEETIPYVDRIMTFKEELNGKVRT